MNIFKNISGKNILASFSRFPVSLIFFFVAGTFFLLSIHNFFDNSDTSFFTQLITALSISGLFSFGLSLVAESYKITEGKKIAVQLLALLFFLLHYFTYVTNSVSLTSLTFIITSLLTTFAFILIAPFFKHWKSIDNESYYYYTIYFFRIISESLLLILGGCALVFLAFGGSSFLFSSIEITEEWYATIFALFAFFFAPLYATIKTEKNEIILQKNTYEYGKFQEFTTLYFAIPAMCIYFGILYSYTIKLFLNMGKNTQFGIAWFIIFFSFFGYLVYYLSLPFFQKNIVHRTYGKLFPFFVIPQVFVLFYAIFIRVQEYGITTNRYLIILFGIFLLCISLYYIFSKRKFLASIPAIFSGILILFSFGPWSIYRLPKMQQLHTLKNNFGELQMYKGNTLIPLNEITDENRKLARETRKLIRYICSNYSCDFFIEKYPEAVKNTYQKQYKESDYFRDTSYEEFLTQNFENELSSYLQLPYEYSSSGKEANTTQINAYLNREELYPLAISEYEIIDYFDFYDDNFLDNTLTLNNSSTLSVSEIFSQIYSQKEKYYTDHIKKENMTFSIENETIQGIIIFESINLTYKQEQIAEKQYRNLSGYILYNEK